MNWTVEYLPEAVRDMRKLDHSQRVAVVKAIRKVQTNPFPVSRGGYGKPLGNRSGSDLAGFLKIKFRDMGIRVVYKLIQTEDEMLIVVIGAREDEEVYAAAEHRAKKHDL